MLHAHFKPLSCLPLLASIALQCSCGTAEVEVVEIELGVDVHLFGVDHSKWDLEYFIAVGSEGVVVDRWGQQWVLGASELRDIATVGTGIAEEAWIVVGNNGT